MRFYSSQRKKTRKPLPAKLIRNHFNLLGFDLLKISSRWQPSSKAIGMVIVLIAGVCGCGKLMKTSPSLFLSCEQFSECGGTKLSTMLSCKHFSYGGHSINDATVLLISHRSCWEYEYEGVQDRTTIGKALAEKMGWPFEDADCYHPAANVSKMNKGIPLTDEDRLPWLVSLHEVIQKWCNNSQSGILACSALKRSYRQIIIYGKQSPGTDETSQNLITVFLEGSRQLIQERMLLRDQHFMPISLLDSQIEIYEPSDNSSCSLNINIEKPVDEILYEIIEQINKMLKN